MSGTRWSSVVSALQLLSGRLSNTASEHQADRARRRYYHPHIRTSGGWPNQWSQHIPVASAQLHQQQRTDSVNGEIYSDIFHAKYSREPPTSTSEADQPDATARKEAKRVSSDAIHSVLFYTTLQLYRSKVQQRNNVLNAQTHVHFHPAQHGFRPRHSTCTALSTITAVITAGFSRKKPDNRTVLIALALTVAFDNVVHHQLLDCFFKTNIPAALGAATRKP